MTDHADTATTPGLVCAHHHLYSALARGMPAPPSTPGDFGEILELVWWRLDRALDPESIRWSAMLGALEALERAGIKLLRAPVGDRYVVELMRREGLNLGGEQSGHIVFLDHITTGDGLLTSLQVLALMLRRQRRLSELAAGFERFPQVLHAVPVRGKPPLAEIGALQDTLRRVEGELAGRGRVLVRYSGTEPIARVMVEGEDAESVERAAQEICGVLREAIGGETR